MNRHEPEQLNHPDVSEEYSLEDIIREFGTPEEPDNDPPEEILTDVEVPPEPEIIPPKDNPSVSDDTMVFKPVHHAPLEPDLEAPTKIARNDPPPPPKIKEVKPQRKEKRAKAEKIPPVSRTKECVPVSPQERLKECRKGLGMRHMRVLFAALPVLAGLFLLLYHENAWNFLPFVQNAGYFLPLLLLSVSIALSYDVFITALFDLVRLRIGLHTLTCITAALSVILTLSQRNSNPQTYCAVSSLLLFAQLRALHAERVGNYHTLRTICSFDTPMGIFDTHKSSEKSNTLRRETGNVSDFLYRLEHRCLPRRIMRIYATGLFIVLPILSYLISGAKQLSFIHVWLLLLMGALPCGFALSFVRPFASIAKRLSGYRGALCGWHGARIFGRKHTIVLSDEDLFPKKNISSNGMKIYGAHKPHRIIAYALAALRVVESPLVDLFRTLLDAQYGKQVTINEHRIYDEGGIGAQIGGEIVLVGSLSFMRSMGVHMPDGTKVRQAVYVSVDGELAGIFAVKYKPSASTRTGLRDVLANHNFSVILATRDFLISSELIAAKYELPTDTLQMPRYSERLKLAADVPTEGVRQGALIAKDTFGAFAVTVASGRTLRLSTMACLCINLFVGVLGFLLCMLLLAWDALSVAAPLHIAAFQLLWALVSSFISFIILKF